MLRDTGITIHVELSPTVRYALESDLGLPQLTPPICLYPQRPVWRLDSLRAISRASGYDAPCAVVPARHYSKQRAQSTMHTSGILCLIDKCAASIRYLLQGRRRASPNYKGEDEPLGRAALSLSLSLSLSYRTGCPRHFACPLHPSCVLRLLRSLLSSWVPHMHLLCPQSRDPWRFLSDGPSHEGAGRLDPTAGCRQLGGRVRRRGPTHAPYSCPREGPTSPDGLALGNAGLHPLAGQGLRT